MSLLQVKKRLRWAKGKIRRELPIPQAFFYTNTVFIHVPKCAGQSIGLSLYGCTVHHFTASAIMKRYPKLFFSSFKFAVVRDPLDRYLSAFSYLKGGGRSFGDRRIYKKWIKGHSLDSFANVLAEVDLNKEPDLFHFYPQNTWVCHHSAKNRLLVDRIYNINDLYQLEQDFSQVSALPPLKDQISFLNKSKERKKPAMSDQAKDVLSWVYRDDFLNFF